MSTSESKRKSSSKHSQQEHHEEKTVDDDDAPVEEVHTANNWEGADLGDAQRKQKFLRLMGAKKRKDDSPPERQTSHDSTQEEDVSPEKKHCRSKDETETINRELEKQFNESLQSKIAYKHHGGLGFHNDTNSAAGSGDWQHQSTKATFVPAKTESGSSLEHVKVDDSEKIEEKSSDKQEKKKKFKS